MSVPSRSGLEAPILVLLDVARTCTSPTSKVRYRGLAKNGAQLNLLVALSNLWMARKRLLESAGTVRPQGSKKAELQAITV